MLRALDPEVGAAIVRELKAIGYRYVTLDLQGYRMTYRAWGSASAADALVLIHGIPGSSLSWVRVAPQLAARSRVIAVDLKGHGDSDRPATGYRIADQTDEVAGLCEALGLQKVSVIGHSWGSSVALSLACTSRFPGVT